MLWLYEHLLKYKTKLSQIKDDRHDWYALPRRSSRHYNILEEPKLILRKIQYTQAKVVFGYTGLMICIFKPMNFLSSFALESILSKKSRIAIRKSVNF